MSPAVQVRPMDPDEQVRFAAARLAAGRAQPYLNTALFALTAHIAEGLGTFGVDRRWRLYLDPELLEAWSVEECAGVLLHEVGHLVRDHARRAEALGGLDAERRPRWNLAGDLAINDDLLADGVRLPGLPVTPTSMGLPTGLLEEEYFALLDQRVDHVADRCTVGAGDCGSGGDNQLRAWEAAAGVEGDGTTGLSARAAATVRLQVAQAVRAIGAAPAGWRRWAEPSGPARSDWRRTLRVAIRRPRAWRAGHHVTTWQRAHRRSDERDEVLRPGSRAPAYELAVILDTSGSMSDAEIAAALAEIEAIQRQCGLHRIWFVACDARPRPPQRVRRVGEDLVRGGGGTDLRPAIELLRDLRPRPDVAVVLTDGWTPWPTTTLRGTSLVVASTDRPCPLPHATNVRITSSPAGSGS